MDLSFIESRSPATRNPAWREHQRHALRASIAKDLEEAFRRERCLFRVTYLWMGAGFLSLLMIAGLVLGMNVVAPSVIKNLLGLMGLVALALLLLSLVAFPISLMRWLLALGRRRRAGYPIYHPDLPQKRIAGAAVPPLRQR